MACYTTSNRKPQASNLTCHSPGPNTNTSQIPNSQIRESTISNARCHTSHLKPQSTTLTSHIPYLTYICSFLTYIFFAWMGMVLCAVVHVLLRPQAYKLCRFPLSLFFPQCLPIRSTPIRPSSSFQSVICVLMEGLL